MKMLQAMMGGMDGAPGSGGPGGLGGGPGLSPDDIAKATGLPSFVTNMIMGNQKAPPSRTEIQATRIWKIIHVIFATLAGVYLIFAIDRSTRVYGENPPAPAMFQNPFLVFLTGEVLVQSARIMSKGQSGKSGIGLWIQMAKEFTADGAILVFMLGISSWIRGTV